LEINKVIEEMDLEGCFLQGVRQADWNSLYFEFYRPGQRKEVLVCLAPQKQRLHEVQKRPPTLKRAPRFAEFLRARLVGTRLVEVRQLGTDRIVLWKFLVDAVPFHLWIRLWGGAANVVVTDAQNIILDAAFRRPKSGETSGIKFEPETDAGQTASLASFQLRDLPFPPERPDASYSERLALWYGQERPETVERLREQALRLCDRRLSSLDQAFDRVRSKIQESERQDDYKTYADLLTSHAWSIPSGSEAFEAVDWRDNNLVRLPLDPKLTPHQNAQKWYKRYQKARDGGQTARQEKLSLEAEAQIWREHAQRVESMNADELQSFLEAHRKPRPEVLPSPSKNPRPGLGFESNGFSVWVGRTAKENEALLRRWVRGNDVWMHTRDVPGGFVFIRAQRQKSVPLETLLDAGMLAVTYSKAKNEGRGDLYYTAVKYLRRAQNGPAGLVLPTQEKNLYVVVDPIKLARIFRTKQENV